MMRAAGNAHSFMDKDQIKCAREAGWLEEQYLLRRKDSGFVEKPLEFCRKPN